MAEHVQAEHVQAEPYERTQERRGDRNGYKPRQLTTRVGTLQLRVAQVRDGSFSPELFARYQHSEQALVCTLMELVVNGVSTRTVAQITEELCGKAFSKSTVSALCQSCARDWIRWSAPGTNARWPSSAIRSCSS